MPPLATPTGVVLGQATATSGKRKDKGKEIAETSDAREGMIDAMWGLETVEEEDEESDADDDDDLIKDNLGWAAMDIEGDSKVPQK